MARLEDASSAGDWRAATALGDRAVSGYRTTKDFARAFHFYKIALLEGGTPVQQATGPKLESLSRSLSEGRQAEASEQARLFIEQHRAPLMFVLRAEGTIPTFKDLSTPVSDETGK